ncbi:MAG: methionyl-tRNA formyltransferase [Treponema sp.]
MLKVLYAGSPEASAKTLALLLNESLNEKSNYKIVGVLTNPPSAQGRHKELVPTDVAKCALAWNEAHNENISIFTPEHLDSACREEIAKVSPDIFVCFAYGHIFGPKFLSSFKLGGINLHPSLLPKYRGCTPVNAAILNCDKETGFSIQKIVLATDEGDILEQKKITLTGTETAESLLNYFAEEGGKSLVKILSATAEKNELPSSTPQSGASSYCNMIKKDDGKINWSDTAEKIDAEIRAYTPWPGCFTDAKGVQLRILKARAAEKIAVQDNTIPKNTPAVPGTVLSYEKQRGILIQCGSGVLIAQELQWQAKKAMDYKSFMNGARDFIGTVLS